MNNFIFLVKADLLLHEVTFVELRNFVKGLDVSLLNPNLYHVFDYSDEKDGNNFINYFNVDFSLWSKSEDLINIKIKSGFVLLNFATLKSLLSLM